MVMPQRDETIAEIKRLGVLLEGVVMHNDQIDVAGRFTVLPRIRTQSLIQQCQRNATTKCCDREENNNANASF